jgi:hypothetical protein
VLALLDAEAGEPEPTCPCEQRAAQNNADPTAPPPSDARERLAFALSNLVGGFTRGTMWDAADAILAVHREELEPIAENLNATAINANEAFAQVAVLTARVDYIDAQVVRLSKVLLGWKERAAPSGDAAQDVEGARGIAARSPAVVGGRVPEPVGQVAHQPGAHDGVRQPVTSPAPSSTPAPASAWPSEQATMAFYNRLLPSDGLADAFAVDLPQIERAAEERGARAFAKWYSMDDVDDYRGAPGAVDRWLAQRAEGTP